MWTKAISLLLLAISLSIAYPQFNLKSENILNISKIINKIDLERNINTFRIVNAHATKQSCLSDDDIRWLSTNNTVNLQQANSPCGNLSSLTNDDMLLIRCLPPIFKADLLEMMIACLGNNRHVRILFIWNTEYNTAASLQQRQELKGQQQLLFEYCAQMHLLNVMSIYRDYAVDGHFYTFSYFPQFNIQRKTLVEDCFPDRIKDIKGAAIRTAPDQLDPWTIVWRDGQGIVQIGGFLTKIVREFALRINATLTFPVPVEPDVYDGVPLWSAQLRNDTVDVIIGTSTSAVVVNDVGTTTPVLPVDWIIMVPMPPLVPDSAVLLFILNSVLGLFMILLLFVFSVVLTFESVLWRRRCSPAATVQIFLWVFINVVLRCVIGQPSCVRVRATARYLKRCLYFTLFFSGIFMSTYISAGLQSYSTSKPPKYSRVKTMNDFVQSKIPMRASAFQREVLPFYIGAKKAEILRKNFVVEHSHDKLQRQRLSMDGTYAYNLLSPLWPVLARYQSNLPRPLYYISEQIYFSKSILMSIPIQKHSIYREALNNFLGQLHSAGLVDQWTRQGYDDMVAAKKLNTTRVTQVKREHLELEDFYWLWYLYGIGMSLAVLVFCTELWYYNKKIKNAVTAGRHVLEDVR
ncbi:PREDICTED: uncharacterized protein LOC108383158 [Rhagoletis zephyria]|uniref:uncharacterized protein LOC108383158 n=1 Tax=Rhagoletis zephyria TaxID=28612 RepID=UPI00081142FD|nr:PREDICTED: uncharacterized protein LOC108383158 [Rhagoletis zephyria]